MSGSRTGGDGPLRQGRRAAVSPVRLCWSAGRRAGACGDGFRGRDGADDGGVPGRTGRESGVVKVHLYRPFSVRHFVQALPPTVKAIAVLDRTKEPGSIGEPLYLDVVTAVNEGRDTGLITASPRITGGRYGLSSKEFTPAMVKSIFEELRRDEPKNHFTVGINDDVTYSSLDYDPGFAIEGADTVQCVYWGLGSDGTVGANKNSIKIIGEETDNYAQGYFVYDSKKSGSVTISHLRFGPHEMHAPYLIGTGQANFVACHQFSFLERFDVLKYARPGGVFLLASMYGPEEVWGRLPREVQQTILDKQLRFYVIDAFKVASDIGMCGRINTVMQTCFFAISGILPEARAIAQIKQSIRKTYGKRGEAVVQKNFQAVDATLEHLYQVNVPTAIADAIHLASAAGTAEPVPTNGHGRGKPLPMLN